MKFSFKILTTTFVILISSLSIFSISSAQDSETPLFELPQSADLLSVVMIPSVPKPSDHVVVDLKSYLTNIDRANISWSLNGEVVLKGIGEKHFEFDVGKVGEETKLSINIQSYEGESTSKTISIRPGNIDLLWEAMTYTPPFYKGKSLYTTQSDVKIIAMPDMTDDKGARVDPKNLIYQWKLGGKIVPAASGYGKNSFYMIGSTSFKNSLVEVEVTTVSGNSKAKGRLSLKESSPEILFYENNPILGIVYEKAIQGDVSLQKKEVTLSASPYFFSTAKKNSNMSYNWYLNGNQLDSNKENSITIRNETGEEGTAQVRIDANSTINKFQFVKKSLTMNFDKIQISAPTF